MAQVVLASQSPRRRELLGRVFAEFEVIPSGVEETAAAESPREYVISLAKAKAQDVASRLPQETLVIGSDTVVVLDGKILEKPKDEEDAFRMLSSMSGRMHEVYTGLALCKDGEVLSDCEVTKVWFRPLSEDAINRYIASGEPMDKAGAYGIQQKGALLVKGIEGDYFNVVGLPLCKLCELLDELGYTTL
ncbi:MAG: septum formation inhibitor Maf [Oscillospiraceae bacterium]|nr:septum formation inhibitor Maf [Oscillospiraceae bacterium]